MECGDVGGNGFRVRFDDFKLDLLIHVGSKREMDDERERIWVSDAVAG